MILHLAHMLSWRGMRRLLWALLLLVAITIAIRHPYLLSSFLSRLSHLRTGCHPMKWVVTMAAIARTTGSSDTMVPDFYDEQGQRASVCVYGVVELTHASGAHPPVEALGVRVR